MKTAYLADQRHQGDGNDPFLEADRRETARQEAAAKRVHPTLHLPPVPQPSTQVAGLFASSTTSGSSIAPQTSGTIVTASSGSGLSLFSTPSSAPSLSSSSLFATPSMSAPASSLFGTTGASPQTPHFGSSPASLFGSASTPSLFGSSAPSLGSTPAVGGSLFSTPFASGSFSDLLLGHGWWSVKKMLSARNFVLCFEMFVPGNTNPKQREEKDKRLESLLISMILTQLGDGKTQLLDFCHCL